ncbi:MULTISPECIES: rod shape-determining protein MreD [unclassified Polaromonas]|jgi:rod shape-determining protein MreD|uniref:rod shape-determining protein MreD n=1 Tax=unclassified Polaromonas TaxID=2638319 RepID=UPI0018CB09CE|nr:MULTISPECIES: rod shape-determining protein MreD [unclassified Polaromonas]MBG6073305.1 rod shape-determining protein MreD [Polaromonas sp. CG_9.7]MBG6115355.1 rod shape-determining protein MreD [Polaromonas sp. CG_9.2]MDH6182940.1 rod shape-determining protein MreD [Polaromonas sp. CG_23.6]
MIMRSGQQLLLPASPVFIWSTLAAALLLNMLPLGRVPWMPDLLALVLVFWNVHQPLRVGIGIAFMFGLAMDVHQTSLLGQHAFSYVALSFFASMIQRRLLWFTVPLQALQVLPLFAAAHAAEIILRLLGGGVFPGWIVLVAPLAEALLWPLASVLLLVPQLRTPDRDENRPL